VAAGRRGRPAATDGAIPNLPGPPYLDRDAERAYLTQIIKDDDLVSAFLARLLPLGVAIRRI
jgi:hypothetical protein